MLNYDLIPKYLMEHLTDNFKEFDSESLCEKVTKPIVKLGYKTILELLAEGRETMVVDYLNSYAQNHDEPLIIIP